MKYLVSPLIVMIFWVLSPQQLEAQHIYAGPALGINMTSMAGFSYHYDEPHSMNGQFIGIKTGAVGIFEIAEGFALQTELLYSRKGQRLDLDWDTTDYSQKGSRTIGLSYFEIPVMVKKFFGSDGVRAYVNAGPYWGYWMGGSDKYSLKQYLPDATNEISNETDFDFNAFTDQSPYSYQRWDMGLTLGGGFSYETGPGLFMIDIRYSIGYRDLYKWADQTSLPADYRELKTKAFSLSFGYLWDLY